jgi:hypothetical protein
MYALGKIRLAGYKLSDRDVTNAAEDTVRELRNYGQWDELDQPIEPQKRVYSR